MCHFWIQNAPFVLNKKSSVKIVNITSIYILTPFSVQIFKKFLRGDPELWEWTIFGSKLVHLPQTRTFLGKIINTIFIYLLNLSLCKILKKFLQWIQSYKDVPFLDPKWVYLSKRIFFSEKPCSYHSCLSASQKNAEISLAKSHFWLLIENLVFPRHVVFFCRMLKNHKNFCFTSIPDKIND